ncbi:Abi family protein [Deinococcus petrolearius]|uniref:Abi family protein n=1 Tax=Deinococcus petrolearius TaxID=1751295 RepID=A0ABW1DLW2_9DEIO
MKPVYNKTPLKLAEQLQHLTEKGLSIADSEHAGRVLRRVGLYRLKGYLLPYKTDQGYRGGVTFAEIEHLMSLDDALRLHILSAMPLVEVGIRQAITQYMLETYGLHWYASPTLFAEPSEYFDHQVFLAKALDEFGHMPDLFVGHYREKYNETVPPPVWMVAETMTLGSWSKLFEAFAQREDRNRVAQTLGLNGKTLTSWLHALTIVRNICAHHSRLYDRTFGTMAVADNRRIRSRLIQASFAEADKDALRLAPRLYAVHRLTQALDPGSTWTADLKILLHSRSPELLSRIGLRSGWHTQPEWEPAQPAPTA